MADVRAATGAAACLQCHKCTAGCPLAEQMDLQPSQVVRLVQLGDAEGLLASRAIWICASCQTCSTRCPAGVDVALVQDRLRRLCLAGGREPADRRIAAAHDAFLATIERFGRLSEIGFVRRYKMRTGAFFENVPMGLALFRRGKLRLRASRVRDRAALRPLIRRARRPAEGDGAR
jgi:heterodisulfide reductase subunit C/quinone-modifying oxidoreductase subunit QmoC